MLSQEEQGRGGGTQEFEIPVTVRCRVRGKGDQAIAGVEVIDAFREVQAAEQERDRLERQADAYANRVLAGARGDTTARIFSTNFGPELVSIAGVYRTFERGIPQSVGGRSAQVRLTGTDNLHTLEIIALQSS